MAKSTIDLPVHFRTGLRAVGIVGGRPVWPILGGEESDEAAAQAAVRVAADVKAAEEAKAAADAKSADDKGYPEGTPVVEMTDKQQAAYYKAQARKHEDRNKAIGLTADQVAELKEKAARADKLEYDLASDKDKAIADAKKAAEAEVSSKYLPQLVSAEFRAAAAGRIEPDRLTTILEPLDMSKFLAADGSVDTDKVTAFVDGIAPVKGTEGNGQQQRRGPSSSGQGDRGNSKVGVSTESGRELYRSKHPAKK